MTETPLRKRHHYVPVFNLALFTTRGDRDDRLYVMRTPSGECFWTAPTNIGVETHYYRVPGVPDVDPMFLEKALDKIESEAAPVVRTLVETERLPRTRSPEYGILMNYLSLQAARVPAARQRLDDLATLPIHLELRAAAATPERTREKLEEMHAAQGTTPPDEARIAAFVKMVRERNFTIEQHPAEHILALLGMHDAILQSLAMRWWAVFVRRTPPLFITCDSPVVLAWGRRPPDVRSRPPALGSPGFALAFTEVTFPVSRHVALVGTFEKPPSRNIAATPQIVGAINSRTAWNASRFLAGPSEEMVVLDSDRRVVQKDSIPPLLRELHERRSRAREAELAQLDRMIPLPSPDRT